MLTHTHHHYGKTLCARALACMCLCAPTLCHRKHADTADDGKAHAQPSHNYRELATGRRHDARAASWEAYTTC